jgi:hypothetical protein
MYLGVYDLFSCLIPPPHSYSPPPLSVCQRDTKATTTLLIRYTNHHYYTFIFINSIIIFHSIFLTISYQSYSPYTIPTIIILIIIILFK